MPRDWHPLRFFVRDNGRPYPTILFWIFLIPAMTIVLAGCYTVLNRRAEQETVEAALTKTPTPTRTITAVPAETATPNPPTAAPAATEFVYDDPSDWEFVEKTDPTGKKYMDLQDWQKEQVWHAFETFWNLFNRSESGLPDSSVIEPYIAGAFVEFVRGDFESAMESGRYIYLVERLEDIPHRAMVLESADIDGVKVKVVLVMDRSYQVQYRDVNTGEILEEAKWLPYETWSFIMAYRDGRWVVEEESHELFEE